MNVALLLCPQWDMEFATFSLALLSAHLRGRGHVIQLYDLNKEMASMPQAVNGFKSKEISNIEIPWLDAAYVRETVAPIYHEYWESVVSRILAQETHIVGFSIYFSNRFVSLELARRIKARDPKIKVVFGGPACLKFSKCLELIKEDSVDAVVFGEADISLPRLVDEFDRSGELKAGPGILLSESPETWREEQETVSDLDTLPYADFTDFNLSLYPGGKSLHTSRGCVRRCTFCSEWRASRYRQMSGQRIYAEIEHQINQDPQTTEFIFADSLLNGDMKALSSFCDLLLRGSLKITWGGYAIVRPEMTRDFMEKMYRAGCRWLLYGRYRYDIFDDTGISHRNV
jgi:radical SAM superfamily enzyme YgiQ (UPF0313 family)